MEQNRGHSFDLDNPVMLYKSFDEAQRQLVESSLTAHHGNINLKPDDIPVCRITAPVVLRSMNIKYKDTTQTVPLNAHEDEVDPP